MNSEHRSLDPRSKLFASLVATAILIMLNNWSFLAAALAALVATVFAFRLVRPWLVLLRGLGFAAVSFFVIAWWAFDMATAVEAGLRLLAIGTVFFLFFQTTAPNDLSNALVKLGFPPAFTFVLTVSMQFIPVLIRRAANIRDAQMARGIPVTGGVKMVRYLPALMGPMLIQAFKLADEMAEAMEARGFGARGRRFQHEPLFRIKDWITLAISIVALVVVTWAK